MNNSISNEFCITMPHRHTVIYSDAFCEVSFEIEINNTESVLWEKSAKCIRGGKQDFVDETNKVKTWLSDKFPNRITVEDRT